MTTLESVVPEGDFRVPIGTAQRLRKGNDITIVSFSYMTIEALHAVDALEKEGIFCDLIDLRTVKPIDWEYIFSSVRKTGRLLALDTGPATVSIASEIIARVSMECYKSLNQAPQRLALPDFPTPASQALTRVFYKRAEDIVDMASDMLYKNLKGNELISRKDVPHDVPGDWFKGPF